MGVTGILAGISGLSDNDIYGTRPSIPDYPELDAAQKKAITDNRAALPDIQDLAHSVNTFNASEIEAMLKHVIPDLSSINSGASGAIDSMVHGQIPADVASLIERKSAERSVAGGFSGSGMSHNLSARDLGLTSLQLVQQGLSSADRWIASARAAQAPVYDVSKMFVSPAEQFAANEGKYQRDLYANTIAAAPNPAARGSFDSEMSFIGMVLSAYGGGAGYQGKYQGTPSPYGGGYGGGSPWGGGAGSSYIPAGGGGGGYGDYNNSQSAQEYSKAAESGGFENSGGVGFF